MSNTIELLESIGRNASLRSASRGSLLQALDGMDASDGLKLAAASGDKSYLADELGHKINEVVNSNNNVNVGGCDLGEGDEPGESGRGDGERDEPDVSNPEP